MSSLSRTICFARDWSMVCLCIDVLACLLLAPLRWGQVRRMQPAALAERALHNRGQAVLRRAGKPPSSILNPVAPEALTFSFSSMLRHYAGGACCGSTSRSQVGHALQRPRVRPQHDVRLSTEAGSAWATSLTHKHKRFPSVAPIDIVPGGAPFMWQGSLRYTTIGLSYCLC